MPITNNSQTVPVKIVGSSVFGRYSTVSSERTWNMFITTSGNQEEEWLVNFAGYKPSIISINNPGVHGRGIFHSVRGNFLLVVIGNIVYRVNPSVTVAEPIGSLNSTDSEVSIDENLSSQIAIVDGANIYIYNYTSSPGTFGLAQYTPDSEFVPNYVTYQNTFFLFGNGIKTATGSKWYVYIEDPIAPAPLLGIKKFAQLSLQTKPDFAIAVLRIPGASNNVIVFGTSVAEIWTDVGGLQVYQRNSSLSIDYGCASIHTIASSDNMVAWLGINEKSSPSIMYMQGGQAQRISSDGIDFLFDDIDFPAESTALFYRQDGHLFYQITFYNPADNFTLLYDFTTQKFYDLTDWDFNYHPARAITYFQGQTYFVSLNNGTLYETGSDITTYQVDNDDTYQIPRMRICDTYRLPTPEKFIVDLFSFTIEQGTEPNLPGSSFSGYYLVSETGAFLKSEGGAFLVSEGFSINNTYKPRIDVRMSKNGGFTWSNDVSYFMHNTGKYKNQPRFPKLGFANEFTLQLRFWGIYRFVIKNGAIEVRV